MEIIGAVVYVFLVAGSNFGGIAGGFALIALETMFSFPVPLAIVLSNAQIVIAAIIRVLSGLGKPHPIRDKHGTLYHFHNVSLMVPMISLGATLATLVSRVIPDFYIVIIYAVILVAVVLYNMKRLIAIIKRETQSEVDRKKAYEIE